MMKVVLFKELLSKISTIGSRYCLLHDYVVTCNLWFQRKIIKHKISTSETINNLNSKKNFINQYERFDHRINLKLLPTTIHPNYYCKVVIVI